MARKFREHQNQILHYILDNPRCGVFAQMGMGKTAPTLTAVDYLLLLGLIKKALIVAPLRVANTAWPDEIKDWPHLQHLRYALLTGSPPERRKALRNSAPIHIINYENLPWLAEQFENVEDWPYDMVVADEGTKLKGFRTRQGTKRARALGKFTHKVIDRFVVLTGTPAPNGVKDLWGVSWFIDGGKRLGRTFTAFAQRWFRKDFTGFSLEPLPHAQSEIEERLSDICFSMNVKDYFDLKEPIVSTVEVNLPPKAAKIYRDMEREMFADLKDDFDGGNILAVNAAGRTQKCLQLAAGAAYNSESDGTWTEVHNEKIKALESVIEEANGMPVLVAYYFKSDLARLLKAFPQGKHLDKDPQTVKDWNAGKIPVLFAHPASAGHGLSLQHGGNILAFFSVNWNLEEHQQIIERIGPMRQFQSGYDRPVYIYYILARGTVDRLVMDRLRTKREVQDLLMEAMKNRD